jgi:DNA-binding response OmpR family regulator
MVSSPLKVALIEDDINLQNMYKLKLEIEGYEVVTAANGRDGLLIVESFMPVVVLLDLRMPIMSGEEMLTHMRSKDWGSDIRVIVLTNISKSEAPQSLRFLNVDRYIVKAHSTPAQVVQVMEEVLGVANRRA